MITIVTGYMRQNTSLMMQVLEASGVPVAWDEERERLNRLKSSDEYQFNPRLYELSSKAMRDPLFPREYDGQAIKLVVPFLRRLAVHDYRVIFMIRDLGETVASNEAGLHDERISIILDTELGNPILEDLTPTAEQIAVECSEAKKQLENRRDVREVVVIDSRALVMSPQHELMEKLGHWDINWDVTPCNPDLYRFRSEAIHA